MDSAALKLSKAFGFLYEKEVMTLNTIASKLPDRALCVNIGAGTGTSAMAILEIRPDLTDTFYTVDFCESGPLGSLQGERNEFDVAKMRYPNQILGDSFEVSRMWSHGLIDYLFIDANHDREFIIRDINGWIRYLRPKDGILVFHDYGSMNWCDVKEVVDEFFGEPHLVVETMAVFYGINL
jgi:SAM-dependent methyltransferase